MKLKALLLAGVASLIATPALAETPTVEGNVGFVTDYRFRGASLSDETLALQGGLDLTWTSGFYVGAWASSIEPVGGSEVEVDVYAGYSGEAGGLGYDVGVLVYTYPGEAETAYAEAYGSLSGSTGAVSHTVGAAWAPEQSNLSDQDNLYLYYTAGTELSDSGIGVSFTLGYEAGAFGDWDGDGDDKINWQIALSKSYAGLDFSIAYEDTTEDTNLTDSQLVFGIGRAF